MGLSHLSFSSTKHEEKKTRKIQIAVQSNPITTSHLHPQDHLAPSQQYLKLKHSSSNRNLKNHMMALSILQVQEMKKKKKNTTLASLESLSMPLIQQVVISADIQCSDCQKRIADIMSRMIETESVLINVLEKSVTITCRYPNIAADKLSRPQVISSYKMAIIKRFFRYSRN